MPSFKIRRIFIYTLMLCALLFFLTPLSTSAQTVNIPDANLRAAITETLGKPQGARITRDEMATLTRLEAHDADIRNLAGLEFATRLEEIRCNNNSITDLSPLAGLTKLHVIVFRQNAIRDLSPVEKLLNLEWLIVPHNLIIDLSPVEDLINLRGLDIGHNVISDLSPLEGLIKLERMWASENPLADLSHLAGLTNLRGYHSWGTPILNLSSLAKLPKLRELDICGGEISDISSLEELTGLERLELANNEISDISPLASLTGLIHLNLRHNQIVDVSPLAALNRLTQIDLQDNEILDFSPLDVFPERVFITRHTNPGFTGGAPKKIEGPWLWIMVPTEGTSGSKAATSGADFLQQASSGTVTELNIATQGAMEGDIIGDRVWTAGKISKRGGNNINALVNAIGLGSGNIDHHVVYGSVNVDSPSEQNTRMFVGGDDAVKVWLNGKLVHSNTTDSDADDFQENFSVTLKEGTNVLLVAVYESEGWWSGFFGFDDGTEYEVWTQSPPIPPKPSRIADVNGDGFVSILDLILVARNFGGNKFEPRMDVNSDGKINILDLNFVAKSMDETAGAAAPAAFAIDNRVSPTIIQAWISQAEIENDGSLAFQQGIANLQQLLALLIPEKTALLTNYPNPFNPETWIPYQLSESTEVTLRIYSVSGTLVRTLSLGHQPAGLYHQRSRAAYWNGKNELGESVASGIYFYTLTAGDFIGTRKMLIMK